MVEAGEGTWSRNDVWVVVIRPRLGLAEQLVTNVISRLSAPSQAAYRLRPKLRIGSRHPGDGVPLMESLTD